MNRSYTGVRWIFVTISAIILISAKVVYLVAYLPSYKTEYSDVLFEDAVVEDVVYTPSRHSVETTITTTPTIDMDGNLTLHTGLDTTDVTVPERFAVVFRCKHGQFIVERKEVYKKLTKDTGKTVLVQYQEVYETKYKRVDGEKKLISRTLVKYHFLDATLKDKVEAEQK